MGGSKGFVHPSRWNRKLSECVCSRDNVRGAIQNRYVQHMPKHRDRCRDISPKIAGGDRDRGREREREKEGERRRKREGKSAILLDQSACLANEAEEYILEIRGEPKRTI